jgi:hypothetical protein
MIVGSPARGLVLLTVQDGGGRLRRNGRSIIPAAWEPLVM